MTYAGATNAVHVKLSPATGISEKTPLFSCSFTRFPALSDSNPARAAARALAARAAFAASILLAFCGAPAALAAAASAGDVCTAKIYGHTWTYTVVSAKTPKTAKLGNGSTACISDASSASGTLTVPSPLGDYKVTAVANNAFKGCAKIEKVALPASVANVYGAFSGCTALKTVSIASGKIAFSELSFTDCPNFAAFELSGDDANANYAVEGGVLYAAGKTSLVRCPTALSEVAPASCATNVASWAFSGVPVRTLRLPDGLRGFGYGAFLHADRLSDFSISETNACFSAVGGVLYSKDRKTLASCPPARAVLSIAAGTADVADYACYACTALAKIDCPASLARVSRYAFSNTTALEEITFRGDVPEGFADSRGGLTVRDTLKVRYPARFAATWEAVLSELGFKNRASFAPAGLSVLVK